MTERRTTYHTKPPLSELDQAKLDFAKQVEAILKPSNNPEIDKMMKLLGEAKLRLESLNYIIQAERQFYNTEMEQARHKIAELEKEREEFNKLIRLEADINIRDEHLEEIESELEGAQIERDEAKRRIAELELDQINSHRQIEADRGNLKVASHIIERLEKENSALKKAKAWARAWKEAATIYRISYSQMCDRAMSAEHIVHEVIQEKYLNSKRANDWKKAALILKGIAKEYYNLYYQTLFAIKLTDEEIVNMGQFRAISREDVKK